jgi:hypothetical protein
VRPAAGAALGWSLVCALFALLALVLSVPLWFVPPLVLVLPPLIWGWLCYRVLAFDALARHAGTAERRFILHHHRWPLRLAGLMCGVLGALPSLLWSIGRDGAGAGALADAGGGVALHRGLQLREPVVRAFHAGGPAPFCGMAA